MKPVICLYADQRKAHQVEALRLFGDGLKRHGLSFTAGDPAGPQDCDLAVMWGHRFGRVIEHQRHRKRRYLVLEKGFIGDRLRWISAGFDGLNGRADFCNRDKTNGRRWEKYHAGRLLARSLREPWRGRGSIGDRVLLVGQVEGDAAVAHIDLRKWEAQTAARIRAEFIARQEDGDLLEAYYRPHPAGPGPVPQGFARDDLPLHLSLARAAAVFTFNSNFGVDAALAGVPVITLDHGAMAWPVAGHLINAPLMHQYDRETWASRLAWCQWTREEIARGLAWAHLSRGLEPAQIEKAALWG